MENKKTFLEKVKILFNLYFTFFKIGSMTFGGGLAMMPMMQKELIEKRNWITDEDLIDYYAVGQSTPGIVAVNVSTFIGYKQAGIIGGIIATFGIVSPSLIIITILAHFINSISEYPAVQKALSGINVAVAALLTRVTVNFSKKTLTNLLSIIITLLSFVLVSVFKLSSFFIILGAVILGCIFHFTFEGKIGKNKKVQDGSSEGENEDA